MSTTETRQEEAAVLGLDGELTIYRAAELKQQLLAALERAGPLEIDLSAVTEVDTAGVQLLMLAKQVALQRQQELRLAGHSPAVLDVFELFNLGGYFGDPLVIGA
ncbi:MAG TPA: STAS domain-containing protein [Janthinobacterium sp.]|nr:STAS domain-containing protein [Janthinobacterium sp.]